MRVDPLVYFEKHPVDEGHVLEVVHQPTKIFGIVLDSAFRFYLPESEHPPREIREFLRLQFAGIRGYARTQASLPLEKREDYKLQRDRIGVLIYGARVAVIHDGYTFRATLANFGKVSFEFSSLEVDRRLAKASGQKPSGEWIYIDRTNGEVVDFYDPFPK
jgi:hypothetical protein